jgi:hypothetical protein
MATPIFGVSMTLSPAGDGTGVGDSSLRNVSGENLLKPTLHQVGVDKKLADRARKAAALAAQKFEARINQAKQTAVSSIERLKRKTVRTGNALLQ